MAIGAPYGGADGNGVVYIYNGGQSGLNSHSPQKILASNMPTLGQGFGISIAGGVDVDGNGYPGINFWNVKSHDSAGWQDFILLTVSGKKFKD